jgi:hypothetical protein
MFDKLAVTFFDILDFRISFVVQTMEPSDPTWRMSWSAENFAILRSIIDTAIKNNQNVVEALSVIAAYKSN